MSSDSWFKSAFEEPVKTRKSLVDLSPAKEELDKIPNTKRKSSENERIKQQEKPVKIKSDEPPKKRQKVVVKSINWLSEFDPTEVTDLAVHQKKIEDVRNWFKINCKKKKPILVIEGPTGSAKTTAFKLIAKELDYKVIEWINKIEKDFASLKFEDLDFSEGFNSRQNQIEEFKDYLLRSSCCPSIFEDYDDDEKEDKKVLLVKDIPNIFLNKSQEFSDVLKLYSENGGCPLVFIVTDTSSKALNVSYNLFPDKIRQEFKIDTISFNPISITLMKRGVKRIFQLLESLGGSDIPPDNVVESLIEDSSGDIRNVILNLQIAAQQSDFKIPISKPLKSVGKKRKTAKNSSDPKLGKNEILTLMHALGRVFYPKREQHKSRDIMKLTYDPESITENFSSQPHNFIQMIHSNYIKNFNQMDKLAEAAENLSLSDFISSEYRDTRLPLVNLDMVIRSVMVLNESPAAGFRKISSYADKKFKNVKEFNEQKLQESRKINTTNLISPKDYFCDYNCYLKLINKND